MKANVVPNQKLVVIEFIIAIVVTKYILSILKHSTFFLQKTNCDMVVAFDEAQNTLNTVLLKCVRERLGAPGDSPGVENSARELKNCFYLFFSKS